MFYKTIIVSFALMFLTNCNSQKEIKSAEKMPTKDKINKNLEGKVIYFTEGENKFLPEYQMNITFKSKGSNLSHRVAVGTIPNR